MPHETGQVFGGRGPDENLSVRGGEDLSHGSGVLELAVRVFEKADGGGQDGARTAMGHGRDNGRGINPSTQKRAKRDVGHEAVADGTVENLLEAPDLPPLQDRVEVYLAVLEVFFALEAAPS